MEKNEQSQSKVKKKSSVGIIGFVLGALGIISCGLTALPGLVLCVIGVILKGHRILSSVGLIICLLVFATCSVWTSPGSIPYPFSVAKYCMTAPAFWVGYDILHLSKAQSQYWFFGGAGGFLFFKAKLPNTFKENEIIDFASEHNWEFISKTQITDEDFTKLLNEKGQVKWLSTPYFEVFDDPQDYEQAKETYEKASLLRGATVGGQFTIWIRENCTILSFDTGNRINAPSYTVINSNGTEMAIYYNGAR